MRKIQINLMLLVFGFSLGGVLAGCAKPKVEKIILNQDRSVATTQNAQTTPSLITPGMPGGKKTSSLAQGLFVRALSPETAADITNAVAKISLLEIPASDLPKEQKAMLEINDRIRKKSDAIYSSYDTTMAEVMRYISELGPQDRALYNKRLTDLFLADSKKRAESKKK